jgi:hypothetical protein
MDVSAVGSVATVSAVPAPTEVPADIQAGAIPAGIPDVAHQSGLAPAIAKLFGNNGVPTPITLNVSYRVVKGLDEIVTVFSDPKTGREIAQFPPEILIGLAEFFDQERGVTLDQTV